MVAIEKAIQKALIFWIKDNYPMIKIATSQNENSRHAVDLGMDIGEPDIRLLYRQGDITYLLYLELKKKKGRLLKSQKEWNVDFDLNYQSQNCQRTVAYGFHHAKICVAVWASSLKIAAPQKI